MNQKAEASEDDDVLWDHVEKGHLEEAAVKPNICNRD